MQRHGRGTLAVRISRAQDPAQRVVSSSWRRRLDAARNMWLSVRARVPCALSVPLRNATAMDRSGRGCRPVRLVKGASGFAGLRGVVPSDLDRARSTLFPVDARVARAPDASTARRGFHAVLRPPRYAERPESQPTPRSYIHDFIGKYSPGPRGPSPNGSGKNLRTGASGRVRCRL
jgi:hypothetical protein